MLLSLKVRMDDGDIQKILHISEDKCVEKNIILIAAECAGLTVEFHPACKLGLCDKVPAYLEFHPAENQDSGTCMIKINTLSGSVITNTMTRTPIPRKHGKRFVDLFRRWRRMRIAIMHLERCFLLDHRHHLK